jgi:chromate transporter
MWSDLLPIVATFLRLGTIAFGGPAAHIAMMQDEVVRRRRWLTTEEFLDYVGATSLIPGPNSTELALYVGRARAGWPGLIVAGVSFIAPAAILVSIIAWAYVRYGALPQVEGILYGIKPIVIGIVVHALWTLGRSAVKTPGLAALGLVALVAVIAGVHEILVLAGAGAVMALSAWRLRSAASATLVWGAAGATLSAAPTAGAAPSLWTLFWIFLKIGSVLFGSGYVLLAFLRADLVERFGWLTERQLLDATAVGQVTPGPVFTTATFIGYLLAGSAGAWVATVGIFLPAFVFVALSGPLIPRIRRSRRAGAALDGVNVASLALMAVVSWQLGRAAVVDVITATLAVSSLIALALYRVNSAWLVAAGAIVGILAGARR